MRDDKQSPKKAKAVRFAELPKPEPVASKEYASSIPVEKPTELLRNRTIYVKQDGGIDLEEAAEQVEISLDEEEEEPEKPIK